MTQMAPPRCKAELERLIPPYDDSIPTQVGPTDSVGPEHPWPPGALISVLARSVLHCRRTQAEADLECKDAPSRRHWQTSPTT